MLGMHGTVYANYAINEADLLLAFGVRFDDRVTGKVSEFAKHGKIVHIDIDPSEINKNKVAHLPIVRRRRPGARRTWCALLDEEPNADLRRRRPVSPTGSGRSTTGARRSRCATPTATTPSCRSTPSSGCGRSSRDRGQLDDTIVTTGVGQHQMWAAQYFHFNTPRHWFTSGGLGSMGFGLPAAIGAQAAHPRKTVIDIDGDGSFLMNIQELACCLHARSCRSRCCCSTTSTWAWWCSGRTASTTATAATPTSAPASSEEPYPTS